jgi:hypothetical protein
MHTATLAALISIPLIGLAACATGSETATTGESPLDRLQRQCDARGGLLTPSGANSGIPAIDNLCNIHGTSIRAPERSDD